MAPKHTTWYTKLTTVFLGFAFVVTSFGIAPTRAHAFLGVEDIVWDPTSFVQHTVSALFDGQMNLKEFVLDGLLYAAKRVVLQSICKSIINWANNGFEGSPAFVTDIKKNLLRLGDAVAGQLVSQFTQRALVSSPHLEDIVQVVATGYLIYTSKDAIVERLSNTLIEYTQGPANESAFRQGDFSKGGLSAWLALSRDCGNNVYCAEHALQDELVRRVDQEARVRLEELRYGSGFLSWKGECIKDAAAYEGVYDEAEIVELTDQDGCINRQTKTPGSVIAPAINKALGAGQDELISADEINEVVSAVFAGLVKKALGGSGLLGLSEAPAGGGRTPLDEATDPPAGTSVRSSFLRTLKDQKEAMEEFKANWQRINDAAKKAQEALSKYRCDIQGQPPEEVLAEEVIPVLEESEEMLDRADAALIKLEEFKTRTENATSTAPEVMQKISEEHQEFTSTVMPSAREQAESQIENMDNTNPPSMYQRMQAIINETTRFGRLSCRISD